jgi:hypothetical protein
MSAISRVNGSAVAATKDALASKLADAKAAEDKNTPQAMNDAAVASKEVVVKDVEKTIEVSNATTSAALKLDSVQISDEAKSEILIVVLTNLIMQQHQLKKRQQLKQQQPKKLLIVILYKLLKKQ